MAMKSVSRDERAAAIIEQGVVVELANEPGLFVVVDKVSGSGKAHLASTEYCDCKDHEFRGSVCKHIRSVRQILGIKSCAMCGAEIQPVQYYIGGRGYVFFDVCSGDGSHFSQEHGSN